MWLSAGSEWPFQGCTVAFALTKKSLCGEWSALWQLEMMKNDLRKQFTSYNRRLSWFLGSWASVINHISLYLYLYVYTHKYLVCEVLKCYVLLPLFFFSFSVPLPFVLWQQVEIIEYFSVTSLTFLVLVLFWLGNTSSSIFWILTVLLLSIRIIHLLQISCECNLDVLIDVSCC